MTAPISLAYKQYLYKILKNFFLLACLSCLASCGSQRKIVSALDQNEANEILVFLSGKGIDANKALAVEAGGGGGNKIQLYDILVDDDKVTEAMSLLNQAGLPRRRGQNLLGIFSNVGLVPSDLEQKIRFEAGLGEQIASTIRKIDGVLDADVQISFPQEDPLNPGQYKGKITASVYVKHTGVLDDPNSHLTNKIKRLVSSSVTGLEYDNVTVIPDRARYSDVAFSPTGRAEEDKQYVNIWSIIVAKDSATRFRIFFFTFVILFLILLTGFTWIGWKVYPLLKKYGGFRELLHFHPIKLDENKAVVEETEEELAAKEKKDNEEDNDRDVDVT